jgi:hypothetical protein
MLTSIISAAIIHHYIENTVVYFYRNMKKYQNYTIFILVFFMLLVSLIGLLFAKTQGLPIRFKYFNEYAYNIIEELSTTFYKNHKNGYYMSNDESGDDVLFIGDSVLQQYIQPISKALDIDENNISLVTKGGCVLLKTVDFIDNINDVSCGDLYSRLYLSQKRFKTVVISQYWSGYDNSVLNFSSGNVGDVNNSFSRWKSMIVATITHFEKYSDNIIIIGGHPVVSGTDAIQPSLFMTEVGYLKSLNLLYVSNYNKLSSSKMFFNDFSNSNVKIIHPVEIFCQDENENNCYTSLNSQSLFKDHIHTTTLADIFIEKTLSSILAK